MIVPRTLETFSEEDWQKVFGAYVSANNSHWTGPPHDVVLRILKEKGRYEFGFPSMGTWASKFRLDIGEDGLLRASFVRNDDLPKRMQLKLDQMEKVFRKEIERAFP